MKKIISLVLLGWILMPLAHEAAAAMVDVKQPANNYPVKSFTVINRSAHTITARTNSRTLTLATQETLTISLTGTECVWFEFEIYDENEGLKKDYSFQFSFADLFIDRDYHERALSLNIFENMEKTVKDYDPDKLKLTLAPVKPIPSKDKINPTLPSV